jgi:hypothetical protein
MKSLNDKELAEINRLDLAEELARAKIKIAEQKALILSLRVHILTSELKEANSLVIDQKSAESRLKEERQSFLKLMQKKHKLKDGWGFDPISGALKESD